MRHILSALADWFGIQDYDGTNGDLRYGRLDRYDGQRPQGETQSHRAYLVPVHEYEEATR